MYSIEYYKTKRKKPEWYTEEAKEENYSCRNDYLIHVKEQQLRNACWDIKSLTIDSEDLFILNDTIYTTSCIDSLCYWLEKNNVKKVTIVNNDLYNEEIIYDIISAKWLINKDNYEYSDDFIIKINIILTNLLSKLNTIEGDKRKRQVQKEILTKIKQLRYYCYQSEKYRLGEIETQEDTKKFSTKEMKRLLN